MTTIACPTFRRNRFTRGMEDAIEINSQGCSPIGEKSAIFIGMRMSNEPKEKSLKNQLLLSITASYLATVPALCRKDILLIYLVSQ
jgi:hypothetical protein